MSLLYPENTVEYQEAFDKVEHLRTEIVAEQKKILNGLEFDLNAMLNQKNALDGEIRRIAVESRFLTEKEIERERLVRRAEQDKKNLILYQDKLEEARISEQRDVSRVANVYVASWAHFPSIPVFPKKIKIGVLSIILGLMIGVGSTFAAYYMDHTIKSPEDLDRHCRIQTLSSLGKMDTI